MMSRSGVLVTPESGLAPPLSDIALSLARQPRFGGHTIDPWSVAEHSMVVALIVRWVNGGRIGSLVELQALLHDAHESVTGDIPSTWKSADMHARQHQLDKRIYATLGINLPNAHEEAVVKRCDRMALLAEAKLLASTGVYDAIRAGIGTNGEVQPEAGHDALVAVGEIKAHEFSAESAAAFYYGWVRRLLDKWRTVHVAAA